MSDDERLLVQQDLSPQLQREANDFYHRRDNTYRHLTRSRNDEAAQRLVFYDEANVSDEEYVVVGNQKHNGRFEESPSTSSYSLLNMERRSAPSPAPTFQPHAIHHSRVDRNANSNVAAYAVGFWKSLHNECCKMDTGIWRTTTLISRRAMRSTKRSL